MDFSGARDAEDVVIATAFRNGRQRPHRSRSEADQFRRLFQLQPSQRLRISRVLAPDQSAVRIQNGANFPPVTAEHGRCPIWATTGRYTKGRIKREMVLLADDFGNILLSFSRYLLDILGISYIQEMTYGYLQDIVCFQCRPVTFLHYVQNPFLPPPPPKKKFKNLKKLKN